MNIYNVEIKFVDDGAESAYPKIRATKKIKIPANTGHEAEQKVLENENLFVSAFFPAGDRYVIHNVEADIYALNGNAKSCRKFNDIMAAKV